MSTGAPAGEQREGSRAARLLHMVRRAERGMLSYDRTGWLEDEPCRPTGCVHAPYQQGRFASGAGQHLPPPVHMLLAPQRLLPGIRDG